MDSITRRGSLERIVLCVCKELAINFDDTFNFKPPGWILMGDLETLPVAPKNYEVLGVTLQAAVRVATDAFFTDGEGSHYTPQRGCRVRSS